MNRGRPIRPVIGTSLRTGDTIRLCGGTEIEAAGFNQGSVWRCCNGCTSQHGGYSWRYEDGGTSNRNPNYTRTRALGRPVIGICIETGEKRRIVGGKAMVEAGFHPPGIWKACNGWIKHHRGWQWEYEDVILARQEHNLRASIKSRLTT